MSFGTLSKEQMMDASTLTLIAGAILSLAFSYIPGLNTWFAALDATVKRLIMAGLLLVVAAGSFGLACLGWGAAWGINLECTQTGLQSLVAQFILAVIANQSVFAISPRTAAVQAAKS